MNENENKKDLRLNIKAAFLDEITADIPALNYDRDDWDAEFSEMKKAGIEHAVMIRSGNGKLISYPSKVLMKKCGCFEPPEDLPAMFLELAEKHGMTPIPDENLREIFAGKWEWGKFTDLWEKFPVTFKKWCEDIGNSHPDGGEEVSHLYDRVIAEVWKIAKENMGKTVLITSHATPIRALRTYWEGLPCGDMKEFPWASNASVSIADYFEDGHVEMISYSEDSFMGELSTHLPGNV